MARVMVYVTPRSGRVELTEWRDDGLLGVRVKAQPEGGKANGEVEALLANVLGIPRSSVRVVRGATSRRKEIRIDGLEQGEVDSVIGRPEES